MKQITVTSDAFENNGKIPVDYTGHGKDISPSFILSELSGDAKSVAVVMDDIDHPLFGIYNHWVIWNLPAVKVIPENIPYGKVLDHFGGASQGVAYGRHKYRGPKPPFNASHAYRFDVYVLDTRLDLGVTARKKDLLAAIDGHILQYGSITGNYK